MLQVPNSRANYIVDPGETVDITVVATKVGDFVSAALDGSPLTAVSSSPTVYRFAITAASGNTQFMTVFCHFPSVAPDDAFFQIFAQGSSGGGKFTGSDIFKTDAVKDRGLQFTVV